MQLACKRRRMMTQRMSSCDARNGRPLVKLIWQPVGTCSHLLDCECTNIRVSQDMVKCIVIST